MSIGAALPTIGAAKRQESKARRVPAPIRGVDARVPVAQGDDQHCIYTFNLQPYEVGMRVRSGYREWQIEVDRQLGNALGVHTIIPFDGAIDGGAGDKLFAVTNEGIWDVTIPGAAPIEMYSFASSGPGAGYGVYCHYVDDAERDVLFYADSLNGLFEYDALNDAWAPPTEITGPIIENIRWVMIHKQRLWLIEESKTSAWYLPVGSRKGQAEEFFFGSKFKHGGSLEGLFNWSVDGGDGLDDYLVAVSHSGDVLPYQGSDPTSTVDWELRGTYFIGEVPEGPFFGSEHGGELYLLSVFGVVSMNDLLRGVNNPVSAGPDDTGSITGKIAGVFRERMSQTLGDFGWGIKLLPSEGGLLISSPRINSEEHLQFYFNIAMKSWGYWRDVPMTAFDTWNGNVVVGTEDSRILYMDVSVDELKLTPPPAPGINGEPIKFSVLTTFQSYDEEALYKKVRLIRPDFLADAAPTYSTAAKYDYDIHEITAAAAPPPTPDTGWDIGLWDIAQWGGRDPQHFTSIDGSWGYGRYVAIATVGLAREFTRLIGWDVIYTTGGPLI